MGKQLTIYPDHDLKRRLKIIKNFDINLIFDIGANDGEYSMTMRKFGFKGKIVSFEPLKQAYENLKIKSKNDNNWLINNYALGNDNFKTYINVAGNSVSSSILEMTTSHLKNAPGSEYFGKEEIEVKTLNSIYNKFYSSSNNLMVKIDTQGYEKFVLDGANELFEKIIVLQLEMALITLYKDEYLFKEMLNYLDQIGFQLFYNENGFSNLRTGQLLQVDAIFVNKKYANL
jgi:FkbM family methyltransferase